MFRVLQGNASPHSNVARLLLMLATAAVLSVGSVSAESPERYARLVHLDGLWEFTITLPPNGFVPEQILVLAYFTRDDNRSGSFLNSSNTPPMPLVPIPGVQTFNQKEGYGHWRRKGPRAFVFESWRFLYLVHDGSFIGFTRSQSDVVVNRQGDKIEGRIQIQLLDVNKAPLFPSVFGGFAGSRVKLVPLPFPK